MTFIVAGLDGDQAGDEQAKAVSAYDVERGIRYKLYAGRGGDNDVLFPDIHLTIQSLETPKTEGQYPGIVYFDAEALDVWRLMNTEIFYRGTIPDNGHLLKEVHEFGRGLIAEALEQRKQREQQKEGDDVTTNVDIDISF